MNRERVFIVMKPAEVRRFINQSDREYFASPVEVLPVYSCVATRQLYATDPVRSATFPVDKSSLVRFYRLTNRQRQSIAR